MYVGFVKIIILQSLMLLKLSNHVNSNPLPHSKCSLDDSTCLTAQAQALVQTFADGIPKIGIKNLDKMLTDPVVVNLKKINYELTDIEVSGFRDTIIDSVSIRENLKLMRISFHSTITLHSKYKVDGVVFSLPLSGEGKAEITLKNMQMDILFIYDILKNEQGQDVIDLQRYYYGFDAIDGADYYFEDLHSGDVDKTEEYNSLLNENWRILVSNFGRFFTNKMTDQIFNAIKLYMRSRPLEDLVLHK